VEFPILTVNEVFAAGSPLKTLSDSREVSSTRRLIFVDSEVWKFHSATICEYFKPQSTHSEIVVLEAFEDRKNIDLLRLCLDEIDKFGPLRRGEPVIAVGGGVLMDVVGFACSMFRRGIPYIRVPSTLIGQIDAGVGVKTGINVGDSKNRLGSYFAPIACINDPSLMATLPTRHVASGLAEAIKVAIMRDECLFNIIEQRGADALASRMAGEVDAEIIDRAIKGMVAELKDNLTESSLERFMDFGHTFSPSFELTHNLLHGEAVAVDMVLCCAIATIRGMLAHKELTRVVNVLVALGLPVVVEPTDAGKLMRALRESTVHRGGKQRLALPTAIGGAVFVEGIGQDDIVDALALARKMHALAH
jgi:3-dehydroquinate synthetase